MRRTTANGWKNFSGAEHAELGASATHAAKRVEEFFVLASLEIREPKLAAMDSTVPRVSVRKELRLTMPNSAQDSMLAALAAKADPSAQRTLVRRLMGRVQRLSRVLLRNPADASDVSQASMVQILKSAGTFRGEGSLESWADRIVFRTAMRSHRAERRARDAGTAEDAVACVRASGDPAVLVRECLDRLPEPQRTALLLRHGFGYSIEEIADVTEVSPNTVKDRLLRGRATIRRLMRREQLAAATWLREGRG